MRAVVEYGAVDGCSFFFFFGVGGWWGGCGMEKGGGYGMQTDLIRVTGKCDGNVNLVTGCVNIFIFFG